MDDVIAFLGEFIAREVSARRSVYTEPDDAAFEATVRAVDELFDPRAGGIDIGRPPAFGATMLETLGADAIRQTLATIRPRLLFLVRRYRHADMGDLYRGYVDAGLDTVRTRYAESVWVTSPSAQPVIVGRWRVCLTCLGAGSLDGRACDSCAGAGWEPAGGLSIGNPGPVLDIRRLVAPSDPVSLADYESG